MKIKSVIAKWTGSAPYFQSALRITAAIIFILAGTAILFAFPKGMPPGGATAPIFSQIWIGGVLEVFGGGLFLIGLFTRPVAFILAGEMAVAYFQFHFPQGFWPTLNGGVSSVLFCFIFLYFSASGAGPWSMDSGRLKKKVRNEK
ncbi:MAG: DoxX family protein [Ignavibacteriae bacterium HGW-Ignavibacteriae-3]|nr:MAG: DoxX family protein [Ignavibacteriae bacterium HGW-Ignavibacteriae-3]